METMIRFKTKLSFVRFLNCSIRPVTRACLHQDIIGCGVISLTKNIVFLANQAVTHITVWRVTIMSGPDLDYNQFTSALPNQYPSRVRTKF